MLTSWSYEGFLLQTSICILMVRQGSFLQVFCWSVLVLRQVIVGIHDKDGNFVFADRNTRGYFPKFAMPRISAAYSCLLLLKRDWKLWWNIKFGYVTCSVFCLLWQALNGCLYIKLRTYMKYAFYFQFFSIVLVDIIRDSTR